MGFRSHAAGLEGMVGTLAVAGQAASAAVRHARETALGDRDVERLQGWVAHYARRAEIAEFELQQARATLAATRRERDDALACIEALDA